uniref:Uncharacterized protein n=1 Tax=Amphimedon queenslandica TaxID=400682 RepID=A0A1X7VGX0_AMPQE
KTGAALHGIQHFNMLESSYLLKQVQSQLHSRIIDLDLVCVQITSIAQVGRYM